MTSSKKILLPGMASVIATVGLLGGCGIFGGGVIECDDTLGVCPRPAPGIVMDDGGFEKSVWAEGAALPVRSFSIRRSFNPPCALATWIMPRGTRLFSRVQAGS